MAVSAIAAAPARIVAPKPGISDQPQHERGE